MTTNELLDKVQERMGRSPLPTEDEIIEAACWFVACKEAADMLDAYSFKDWARAIQAGETLPGPFTTRANLDEWIEFQNEAMGGDYWDWLDKALDRHFGRS